MKRIIKILNDHPRETGESYAGHLLFTLQMALRMLACGCVLIIHGLLPFLFVNRASTMMKSCHKILCDRADKKQDYRIMMSVEEMLSRIIYRDQLIIVLNKPVDIPVHAGSKGGSSLEDYFEHMHFDYKERPHLTHRLDRDTSGCLILGRNHRALRKVGKLFESRQIHKTYWAIIDGTLPADYGFIDTPLKKVKLPLGWSMQPAKKGDEAAQTAETDYKVLKKLDGNRSFVELYPRTGRTHQLRVHMLSLGCPIVGDWLYAGDDKRPESGKFPLLHLHARSIEIPLHHDQPPLVVTAEPPPHIARYL